jgi:AcrR family transcriptional regulator
VTELTPQEATRLDREATYRTHILGAAERLVGRVGLERTRMQDVAAEARVALATIYRLYPTKQDVYEALAHTRAGEVFAWARATVVDDASPLDNLMAFTLGLADFLFDHPDTLRFTLRSTPISWGLGEDDAEWSAQRDFHADLVAQCLRDGTVTGTDPRLVARLMAAVIQVYLSDWLERDMRPDRDAVRSAMRDHLLRAFTSPTPVAGARHSDARPRIGRPAAR